MLRAGHRQGLAQCGFGEHRQVPRDGAVAGRLDTGLPEHPLGVGLAGRLDDPGQHQIPEYLIPTGRLVQAQQRVGPAQRTPQMLRP